MNAQILLSRDAFREAVFARDNHRCVICGMPAADAHHIIERRLFPDGGYYLDNGASVCARDHILCEQTMLSVEQVREAAGVRRVVVPPHLYPDQPYDKWGNPVLPGGRRMRGELFFDPSVQKVLAEGGMLSQFTDRVKFPRTHHVPWSPGVHSDDRVLGSLEAFIGQRVIVTEKMDGENTTLYSDYLHARSIDGRSHPSRDWVKGFWAGISADIPPQWRVCGENLYARHSIAYDSLQTYFMGFSVWNDRNEVLPWDESLEWFELLGITPVPVLYDGVFDERLIRGLYQPSQWQTSEGYVVRLARGFPYGDYRRCVGKFVRAGHIQTTRHWMYGQPVVRNGLSPRPA